MKNKKTYEEKTINNFNKVCETINPEKAYKFYANDDTAYFGFRFANFKYYDSSKFGYWVRLFAHYNNAIIYSHNLPNNENVLNNKEFLIHHLQNIYMSFNNYAEFFNDDNKKAIDTIYNHILNLIA